MTESSAAAPTLLVDDERTSLAAGPARTSARIVLLHHRHRVQGAQLPCPRSSRRHTASWRMTASLPKFGANQPSAYGTDAAQPSAHVRDADRAGRRDAFILSTSE